MDLNFENKAKSELDRITLKAEKVELAQIDKAEQLLKEIDRVSTNYQALYSDGRVNSVVDEYENATSLLRLDIANHKEMIKDHEKFMAEYNTIIKLLKTSADDLGVKLDTLPIVKKLTSSYDVLKKENIRANKNFKELEKAKKF